MRRADRSFCVVGFPYVAKRRCGPPHPPALQCRMEAARQSRPLDASRVCRLLDLSSERHDAASAKELLNGSNTERMFQAPRFARWNALGVVPNRFLNAIVMCCCEENPDAAETSEIAESVVSSKLQAC